MRRPKIAASRWVALALLALAAPALAKAQPNPEFEGEAPPRNALAVESEEVRDAL